MFETLYALWMNRQEAAKRLVAKAETVGITAAETENLSILLREIAYFEGKMFEIADLDC